MRLLLLHSRWRVGGVATNRAKANEIKVFFFVGNGDLIDDKMDTLSRFIDQFGPW